MGAPGNAGVNSAYLFVLLAEMDLASGGDDRAVYAANGVMRALRERGDLDQYEVFVDEGCLVVKWWPRFPPTKFEVRFAVASLNPDEAAVVSVMAS